MPAGVLKTCPHPDGGNCLVRAKAQLENWVTWRLPRSPTNDIGRAAETGRRCRRGDLLGARSLRRELVAGEGDGIVALIVPLRMRGWRANAISDPAYGPAVAAAMPPQERGFERPVLVTAEEISEVRAGGDPMCPARQSAATENG